MLNSGWVLYGPYCAGISRVEKGGCMLREQPAASGTYISAEPCTFLCKTSPMRRDLLNDRVAFSRHF